MYGFLKASMTNDIFYQIRPIYIFMQLTSSYEQS